MTPMPILQIPKTLSPTLYTLIGIYIYIYTLYPGIYKPVTPVTRPKNSNPLTFAFVVLQTRYPDSFKTCTFWVPTHFGSSFGRTSAAHFQNNRLRKLSYCFPRLRRVQGRRNARFLMGSPTALSTDYPY